MRCNFVVTAPKGPHSSVFARLASGAFYETIVLRTFYAIINFVEKKSGFLSGKNVWRDWEAIFYVIEMKCESLVSVNEIIRFLT